jgi:hypothetical protein
MTACAPPLNTPRPAASGLITPHAPYRSRRPRGETPVPTPAAQAIRVRRNPR